MAEYGRGEMDGGFSSYHAGGFTTQSRENDFSRQSQTVSQTIQKITQSVSQLQRMVGQIGTTADSDQFRERMHQTTHYTNQLAKDANKDLKELMRSPNPANASEQRQRKMLKERLTDEFSNALKNFQTVQRTAAEKEKASITRARAHSGVNKSPFGFDEDERKSDDQLVGYSQTKQVLQMEEDVDLELLREREDAIKKLESDIMDVNTIFKDLGMLVHEQGEVIDSIEANVEQAHVSVSEGTHELEKAKEYQSKARRKKCCIIIVVVVVLAIIALIIGLTVPKGK